MQKGTRGVDDYQNQQQFAQYVVGKADPAQNWLVKYQWIRQPKQAKVDGAFVAEHIEDAEYWDDNDQDVECAVGQFHDAAFIRPDSRKLWQLILQRSPYEPNDNEDEGYRPSRIVEGLQPPC